jgi:hypothetical protein
MSNAMRESDIKFESGDYWVGKTDRGYTVFMSGVTVSAADSTYPKDDDGLSIAIARCKYLAKTRGIK